MNFNFPSLIKSADWVILPFDFTDKVNKFHPTNDEQNEFIVICFNFTTKLFFNR